MGALFKLLYLWVAPIMFYPVLQGLLDAVLPDLLESLEAFELPQLLLLGLPVVELPRGGAELQVLLVLAFPATRRQPTWATKVLKHIRDVIVTLQLH